MKQQILKISAPPALQPRQLFLQIGRTRHQVADIAEAVAKYNTARDASGLGASDMPRVTIVDQRGKFLYSVSYNGRVWDVDQNGNSVPLDGLSSEEWVRKCTTGSAEYAAAAQGVLL